MALSQEPSVVLVLSMVQTTHGFIARARACVCVFVRDFLTVILASASECFVLKSTNVQVIFVFHYTSSRCIQYTVTT